MKVDGSRLSRATTYGHAVIDLIAPAPASRALHSQPAGRFHVDKFPGIQNALNEPAVVVDVKAVPLKGSPYGPSASQYRPSPQRWSSRLSRPNPAKGQRRHPPASRRRRRDGRHIARTAIRQPRHRPCRRVPLRPLPVGRITADTRAPRPHGPTPAGASRVHRPLTGDQRRNLKVVRCTSAMLVTASQRVACR